jgi:hypothetical protein
VYKRQELARRRALYPRPETPTEGDR